MRKVLFATTALATVAGAVAVANAEVSISGSVEWRYMSVSDDDTAQASDSDFQATNDITISMSSTTDNGLTISQYINIGNGAVGTSESSISGDFGTIAFNQDSVAHTLLLPSTSLPVVSLVVTAIRPSPCMMVPAPLFPSLKSTKLRSTIPKTVR